jgi:hypothetical protein
MAQSNCLTSFDFNRNTQDSLSHLVLAVRNVGLSPQRPQRLGIAQAALLWPVARPRTWEVDSVQSSGTPRSLVLTRTDGWTRQEGGKR